MFIGHYAPAFVAATMPKAPRLGTLFIAAQLVDLAFFSFVLLGVENIRITSGITAMNAMDLYDMPYTHSLLGSVMFAAIMALLFWILTKNKTGAYLIAAVVVSHWFIDLLVHVPDLTLTGSPPKLGLGLWNYPMIEMPLELGLLSGAFGYYLGRTRLLEGATIKPVYWLAGILLLIQIYSWFAPQPEEMDASIAVLGLIAYALFIWLAYRVDRTRVIKGAGAN